MAQERVRLITGTSTGLGRALVEAAAAAGDLVVATARRPQALDDLLARYPDRIRAGRRSGCHPGGDAVGLLTGVFEARAAEVRQWETLARSTDFAGAVAGPNVVSG